ncbi:FecR family protein [Chitinophaga lutea]
MPNIESLFRKFVNGACTEQEKARLFEMIGQPEHNETLLRLLDEIIAETDDSHAVDESKAGEILSLILHTRPVPARRVALRRYRWAAAAAVLVVAAGAATWLLRSGPSTPSSTRPSTLAQDIAPAPNGAVLTLGDGRHVTLDSLGNGVIAHQHGATISLQNGTVSYDDGAPGEATFNTLRTPRGKVFHLILPDGSSVWLNAASALRFPTAFAKNDRTVELDGEAYFDIRPDAAAPFRVKTSGEREVRVLGTGFNVNAYANEDAVRTTLLQGSVELRTNGSRSLLRPGEQGSFLSTGIRVEKADTSYVMAWKHGIFNFENASIQTVMKQLERWYDVDVVYENGVPDIRFGGKLERNLPLSGVIRILEISKVHCRLDGRKLIISQ